MVKKTKKFYGLKVAIMCAVCVSLLNQPIMANTNEVNVIEDENTVSISNNYIGRDFLIKDKKIKTKKINNYLTNGEVKYNDKSEDFVIGTIFTDDNKIEIGDEIVNVPRYDYTLDGKINSDSWKNNVQLTNGSGVAFKKTEILKLFDSNLNTHVSQASVNGNPFYLTVDFGEEKSIASMSVNKRPGVPLKDFDFHGPTGATNGTMGKYEVQISEDGQNWESFKEGEFTRKDYNLHEDLENYNIGDLVFVNFDNQVSTRYLRLIQKTGALSNYQEFTSAEIAFYDQELSKKPLETVPQNKLNSKDWIVSLKDENGLEIPGAETLFDGDSDTGIIDNSSNTYTITMDLNNANQTISSLSFEKNKDSKIMTGDFNVYATNDNKVLYPVASGSFDQLAYGEDGIAYLNLNNEIKAKYLIIEQKNTIGNIKGFSNAEISLYSDPYNGPIYNNEIDNKVTSQILSSSLTYKSHLVKDVEDSGKQLVINYEPYKYNGINYTISQNFVLQPDKHYMQSFLQISTDDMDNAKIDYIELDSISLANIDEGVWSKPDESEVSSRYLDKHELMLGQPIYVNGFFLGSEFPAAQTDIVNDMTQIRYFSGKSFSELKSENALDEENCFVTWNNVVGVAEGTSESVVQTALFRYIDDIAIPTKFRKQYNSWYDNGMRITDESIANSFYGAEAGLTSEGVEPLDCYVVDDGWNEYPESNLNKTGFWEFNGKFPNELYTSSSLSNKLESTFGLWVGPQGGFGKPNNLGEYFEQKGTGYAQKSRIWDKVICTGSKKYIDNFTQNFLDYQKRFNITYWKWDGFAMSPCDNPAHDHIVGGENDMYYNTEKWERWIEVFKVFHAESEEDLWINATNHVNLSPWLLQWVNTIWIQDSGDTGQIGTGERHQTKIYYRDEVYYKLLNRNQFQFPLENLYNHDPIYGLSDDSNATTDVFREYLMANAVRGTAFWELYYSPSIMDNDKWKVTADVLEWAEDNHNILKNAKMFGNQPSNGVYGYSCWNGNEGIISFTNPLDTVQTYTLTVNNLIGAPTTIDNLKGVQVEPYAVGLLPDTLSYGEDLTITIAPHETKILQFGNTDNIAPKILSSKVTGEKEVTLKFNERINDNASYLINGNIAEAELQADYHTVILKSEEVLMKDGTVVNVEFDGVKDYYGNELPRSSIKVSAYKDGVIAAINSTSDLKDSKNVEDVLFEKADINFLKLQGEKEVNDLDAIEGTTDFSVSFGVKTTSKNTTLFSQGDDIAISIDEDGFVEFKVRDISVNSKEKITTVVEKAHGTFGTEEYVPTSTMTEEIGKINDGNIHIVNVIREPNGMLKLYIDGNICASTYVENKINQEIKKDTLSIGGTNFAGYMGVVKVLNVNTEFDYIKANYDAYGLGDTSIELDRSEWTATACSQMSATTGDGPASSAIDGNENTWWHSNYRGADTHSIDEHWIQIDFHKETTFDNFMYTGRGTGSNGSIKEFILEAIIDGEWKTIKTGEMSELKTTVIAMDDKITTTAIRLKPTSTHNGKNFAAAVEIAVSVNSEIIASLEQINILKAKIKELNEFDYTPESYKAYMLVATKIKNIDTLNATVELIDSLELDLQTAYNNLELVSTEETNKLALQIAIELAGKASLGNVVPAVVEEFEQALANAIAINDKASATQDEVNKAFDRLAKAMQMLEFFKGDKKALNEFIIKVKDLKEAEYTEGTWKTFQDALDKAKGVNEDANAMQEEVDQIYTELVKAFVNLRYKPNKDLLKELVTKAEGLDAANYSAESFGKVSRALENARAVLDNPEATAEEVNNANNALTKALSGLEALSPSKPVDSSTPDTPVKKGDKTAIKTGDESLIGVFAGLGLISIVGMIGYRRSKEN